MPSGRVRHPLAAQRWERGRVDEMAELVAQGEGLDERLTSRRALAATMYRGSRWLAPAVPVVAFGSAIAMIAWHFDGITWTRAISWGAAAAAACVLVIAVDRVPSLNRAARGGLAPDVDLRALVVLALALAIAHETGVFPVGALGVLSAVSVASAGWLVAGRLGRPTRIVIIGSGRMARLAARTLADHRRTNVLGVVDDADGSESTDQLPLLGRLDELPEIVRKTKADAVVFSYSWLSEHRLAEAIRSLRDSDVAIAIVPRLFEVLGGRLRTRVIGGMPLLTLDPSLADRRLPAVERAFDVLVAGLLLLLLSPFLVLIALAILVESPGAILYRAERVGQHGRPFFMLKFRKMRPNAKSGASAVTRVEDDRFTRVGRVLHAWKLDELPQLWNVLHGEMALVGPRPEDPRYVALFPDAYRALLTARPGITGVAALKYRDETNDVVVVAGPSLDERAKFVPLLGSVDYVIVVTERGVRTAALQSARIVTQKLVGAVVLA